MLTRPWVLVLVLSLCLASAGVCQSSPEPTAIDAAIRKLRSSSYVQRESGFKELETIGIPALNALRRASKSADAETKRRVEDLIRNFEEQLQTKQILTPKKVHLKVADVTVQQAIAELARISGYTLQFQAEAELAGKKITLDTGTTSFWQAFDQLCDRAGLMEHINLQTRSGQVHINRIDPYTGRSETPVSETLVVVPRTGVKAIVSYAGAVKTEMRVSRAAGAEVLTLAFIVSAEPRLLNAGLAATPRFDKLVDPRNRRLNPEPDPPATIAKNKYTDDLALELMGLDARERLGRHVQIRIKVRDPHDKRLKEVLVKLTLQLDLPNEPVARVEKILEAGGKSADGANGGCMKVDSVKQHANGDVEVRVILESLTPHLGAANIVIRANGLMKLRGGARFLGGSRGDLPDLLDAKGQKYKLAEVPSHTTNIINGAITRHATMLFQPNPGQAEPSELVLFGTRTHLIGVPFRFEDLRAP